MGHIVVTLLASKTSVQNTLNYRKILKHIKDLSIPLIFRMGSNYFISPDKVHGKYYKSCMDSKGTNQP